MHRLPWLLVLLVVVCLSAPLHAPLLGPVYSPSVPIATDQQPEIAYDETNDVFLVVFTRLNPAFPDGVGGVLMRPDGTAVGQPFQIADGRRAQVGNIDHRDSFVVAYWRGSEVHARVVSAATGSVSTSEVSLGSAERVLDVCDNGSPGAEEAPVLFSSHPAPNTGRLDGRTVRILPSGEPAAGNTFLRYTSYRSITGA